MSKSPPPPPPPSEVDYTSSRIGGACCRLLSPTPPCLCLAIAQRARPPLHTLILAFFAITTVCVLAVTGADAAAVTGTDTAAVTAAAAAAAGRSNRYWYMLQAPAFTGPLPITSTTSHHWPVTTDQHAAQHICEARLPLSISPHPPPSYHHLPVLSYLLNPIALPFFFLSFTLFLCTLLLQSLYKYRD